MKDKFFGDSGRKLTRLDVILMLAVTVLYSFLGFYRLGSHEMAVTTWFGEDKQDYIVMKAEEPVDEIWMFCGLVEDPNSDASIRGISVKVDASKDGRRWASSGSHWDDAVFRWTTYSWDGLKQYVRVKATDITTISEIALRNKDENRAIKFEVVEGTGDYDSVNDEQYVIPDYISYYSTGMFDEVYHPRTAYEHLLGTEPTETTHPPLGKWFMTLGICIFGMNFFGYRFMGAFLGVLMLPILYHFAKKLFRQTWLAFGSTVLFSLDFMHLVQTRIGTIDTYAVFFILLMYDAMLSFLQKDLFHDSMQELMWPLLWSGLFFGIGAASKWTVIYGGVGLAVLYFVKLGVSLVKYKKMPEYEGKKDKVVKKEFKNKFKQEKRFIWIRSLMLCSWCVLVFIIIPFIVYFCSYLPYLLTNHNDPSLQGVWKNFWTMNSYMLDFHGNLRVEHVSTAYWYEWPFMLKTMCFDSHVVQDGLISRVVCMGNPVVWWIGFLCLVGLIVYWFKKRNLIVGVIILGWLSVYCPWMLVFRSMFIYHYFTAVPFLCLSTMGVFCVFKENRLNRRFAICGKELSVVSVSYFGVILLSFVMLVLFLPGLVGIPVRAEYLDVLHWLPRWAMRS